MLGARVRELRRARGLTQVQLAELAGVSRQLVGAVEADRHLPRVDAAVGLARALGTSVEELSTPDPGEAVGVLGQPPEGTLVRIAKVGDRRVCVPAASSGEGWAAADAVVRRGSLELFDVERPAAIVAGCDPAIELVARLLEGAAGPRVVAVATSSAAALTVLASGRGHAAMVHGEAGRLPEPPTAVRRWRVARWQVGLAAPRDHPAGWVEDALAGRVGVVQREAGAGSQAAFERALDASGLTSPATVPGPRATGHAEAAWRAGADGLVAVTIQPSALTAGLAFHPLETHESELWVAPEHVDVAGVRGFLDELTGARVRRRLEAIGGYDLSDSGTEVAA